MKPRNYATTQPSYSTFPCPHCHRMVRSQHRFCGFCHKPLQVQCSDCGCWTKSNHVCCPHCQADLLKGGLTFEQRQQLQGLQQQEQELRQACDDVEQRLDGLSVQRSWTFFRLIMVLGVLMIVVLVGGTLAKSLVASLWGIIILLVALLLFRRGLLAMIALIPRLFRWALPRPMSELRIEVAEAYAELDAFRVAIQKTQDAIADLERLEKGEAKAK